MVDQDYSNTMPNDNETRKTGNQLGKCCVCVCVCVCIEREREREREAQGSGVHSGRVKILV